MRLIGILALLLALIAPVAELKAAGPRCFAETGQCIQGRFLAFWEQNGGLAVFGYPITPARMELNPDTGQLHLAQWFERNRLELHPENAPPYDVLLGRIGAERLDQLRRDWRTLPVDPAPLPDCLWFEETSRNLCDQPQGGGFKTFWQTFGLVGALLDDYGNSLALFGLPLTPPQLETNANGDTVITQWFERARFEWHPNNPPEHRVLLGLLGNEILTDPAQTSAPPTLTTVGERAFFVASDGSHGQELWVSDTIGARLVKDICLGPCGAKPLWLTPFGDQLLFVADDGFYGQELWVSDGSSAGTLMIADICHGPCSSHPSELLPFAGRLAFAAESNAHGRELWIADGTTAGATVVDINPGPASSYPTSLAQFDGALFFGASVAGHGLWRSDGTTQGTTRIKGFDGGAPLAWLTPTAGQLFFTVHSTASGTELWASDGSAAGTQLVTDIAPGPASAAPQGLAAFGASVLFWAGDSPANSGLWRSDGTAQGSTRIRAMGWDTTLMPVTLNGLVYFSGPATPAGPGWVSTLWRSDGTAQGTQPLTIGNPRAIAAVGSHVVVTDAACDLWRSDGTTAMLLKTLAHPPCQPGRSTIASSGSHAWMLLDPITTQRELWRSDGSGAGTHMVRVISTSPWLATP